MNRGEKMEIWCAKCKKYTKSLYNGDEKLMICAECDNDYNLKPET